MQDSTDQPERAVTLEDVRAARERIRGLAFEIQFDGEEPIRKPTMHLDLNESL